MDNIKDAALMIKDADALLISASNGLSISEGFNIFADNQDFEKYFGYFQTKYGISNILQGVGIPLSASDHAKFMERLEQYMITDYYGSRQFENLRKIIGDKDYFVITSNADTHFQLNGFNPHKIWEIEGNFFDLEMRSPEWQDQKEDFQHFTEKYRAKKVMQLELGIGAANQLIKLPLMRMVAMNMDWSYITLNFAKEINVLPVIKDRAIAIEGDLAKTLAQLKEKF